MAHMPFLKGRGAGSQKTLVDQRPWQTIESLAPLAVSAEEQSLAREAERLPDHEVDQAFALALRQSSLHTHTLTGRGLPPQQKVSHLTAPFPDDPDHFDH